MVITCILSISFLINNKINSTLNTIFTIPIFVYAYYISNFSINFPTNDTIYKSIIWLLGGAFFLLFFSDSSIKSILYSILALFTISFHLIKSNKSLTPWDSEYQFIFHPLTVYSLIFFAVFLIKEKYTNLYKYYNNKLRQKEQDISKILRDSSYSIVEIQASRDEKKNIESLKIKKVNNSFESLFNIQLHEVKNQDANYIFDLVMHNNFDLNKLLFKNSNKTREYYSSHLDLWFKIDTIKSGYNTFYIIFEDITLLKKEIINLQNSKKRYQVLLEAIPDMFFVISDDGTYEDFVIKENDKFKVEDTNIIGSTIFDVGFPEKMTLKILKCIKSCLKNNSIEIIEYSLYTPNGHYLFEMRLARLNSRSVISIARDITRRKTAEINLEKAKGRAEESDRLKSAFLANLSHEIRTPLNIITNFSQIMAEDDLTQTEKLEFANAISQNSTQLLNMIENTIHLSKIETNAIKVVKKFCYINTMIHDLYNKYSPLIPESKSIKFNINLFVKNSSFGFVTDKNLLFESLCILTDNAIKYTINGNITIEYEMELNNYIKFVVSDSGIGIQKNEFENIFNRFYRIKNNVNEITSGSGIGLPIAQHYIQLLGGELKFKSTIGKGTKFYFSIPFYKGKGYLHLIH